MDGIITQGCSVLPLPGEELPEDKFISVPAQSIEKANVDEFWTTLKKRLGKE